MKRIFCGTTWIQKLDQQGRVVSLRFQHMLMHFDRNPFQKHSTSTKFWLNSKAYVYSCACNIHRPVSSSFASSIGTVKEHKKKSHEMQYITQALKQALLGEMFWNVNKNEHQHICRHLLMETGIYLRSARCVLGKNATPYFSTVLEKNNRALVTSALYQKSRLKSTLCREFPEPRVKQALDIP